MIEPRPEIAAFAPAPQTERQRVGRVERLGRNERTVPLPDDAVRAMLASVAPEELTAVPELGPFYAKLARYLGVGRDAVLASHGADAGIADLFRVYVRAGDEVVHIHPTYHRYAELCALHGARAVRIGYDDELRLDVDGLLAAIGPATRLVVVVNPNNPTGTKVGLDVLEAVAARARAHDALLLVDEVYHHFCTVTAVPLLRVHRNVVVARSFSKALGLAGIRVGALAADAEVIAQLAKVKPRHEISAVAARIAEYVLDHPEIVEDYVAQTRRGHAVLGRALTPLGFAVLPTEAASALVRLPDGLDRPAFASALWEAGWEVGAGLQAPYERFVRVAVGPPDQMERFGAAVAAVV